MSSRLLKKNKKTRRFLYHHSRVWAADQKQRRLSKTTKERHRDLVNDEKRDVWRVNVIEPAGLLLLGDGNCVTGPKNVENRTKPITTKSGTRKMGGSHWVLLVASRRVASRDILTKAQDNLTRHNRQNPSCTSITNIPTTRQAFVKKYGNRLGSALGFVLLRDATENDDLQDNVWADKGPNVCHWIVERALPFETPIKDFGSTQSIAKLETHAMYIDMVQRLSEMLVIDSMRGEFVRPIRDSDIEELRRPLRSSS